MNVRGELMYAGFLTRFGAYIIDCAVFYAATIVYLLIAGGLELWLIAMDMAENTIVTILGVLGSIYFFSLTWLYYAIMESSKLGGTLGKLAVGAVVVDKHGNRITFLRASARFWSRLLSAFPLLIGFIMAGFTQKKQALHDIITDTYVIRKQYGATMMGEQKLHGDE